MASLVQQSTTQLALKFFLVLSSDHLSPATGKTPTVTISKEGAAFGSPAGAVSEIANGWYKVAANATDTNTLGEILLHATEASSDNCDMIAAEVVAFNPQDAWLGILAAANGVETGMTVLQALRLIASTTGGKLSGAGTGTEIFRNAVADSANRVTATVDSSGNRSAITYSL